jgi:flagellar protein FlgJ
VIDPVTPSPPAALTKAAKALEAVFLRQMIASMRAPTVADDPFGSDSTTQFREMSDARLADSMAGGFGIAVLVEKQMAAQSPVDAQSKAKVQSQVKERAA